MQVSVSNGLTWSRDKKTFYYVDSLAYSVDAFDYNDAEGTVSNRRTVLDYKRSGLDPDIPDGMTIDEKGHLWVANFFGSKVICIDPAVGQVTQKVAMPCKNVTSVCWGGRDYSTLFVTTAEAGLSPSELAGQPQAGATFAVTELSSKGLRPHNFRADLVLLENKLPA